MERQNFKPAGCNILQLGAHTFKLYVVYVDLHYVEPN
jgi:hypothetical protein